MRQRLTWKDLARQASAAPAVPNEGPASPAYKPDPEANAYKNGDTSAWAEDPHPGPYENSAHPATPDEGPASPAYKAAALEAKAEKCIRIATAMLGKGASYSDVEEQALALMDLSDRAIEASLLRLGGEEDEEEDEIEVEDEDEIEVEDEDEEESKKKAFLSLTSRIARLERILVRLAAEEEHEESKKEEHEESKKEEHEESKKEASSTKESYSDEEALLEQMLAEEGMSDSEEAMLEQMLAEEGMDQNDPEHFYSEGMEHESMEHESMEYMEEPMDEMGLVDMEMGEDEMMILAQLYGRSASEKKEEESQESEESKKKTARLRPQPKRASNGATRLGGPVAKAASDEIGELAKLWESAPDVSKHF
jgi:hypothetical protein